MPAKKVSEFVKINISPEIWVRCQNKEKSRTENRTNFSFCQKFYLYAKIMKNMWEMCKIHEKILY